MARELRLSVEEAKGRDAGRSIARVSISQMEKLQLVSGDVIELKGKSSTPVIVWPGYPEDDEKIIRIDGITRSNAQVGINDEIKVRKAKVVDADKVTVNPTKEIRVSTHHLKELLKNRPFLKGQYIRVETLEEPITFVVSETKPSGIAIVVDSTKISLKKPMKKRIPGMPTEVTYEDIGGLKNQLKRIREMVELPLRQPELFNKLGIVPPKGVLLLGPPGTGKTLLAKAVANEVDANFVSIAGPEVFAKYYGESEKRLRGAFAEAERSSPSILFIDEIDAIAPKRSEMTGNRSIERRVVSQLLTSMDGLKSRGQVVVIATTNQPDLMDEALRRTGRFDRELEIGVPDRNERNEIFEIHTRAMPLAENVDLDDLSDRTHGFVGADISGLCKEAGMHALGRISKEYGSYLEERKPLPPEVLEKLEVKMEDFEGALRSVEPSAMREVFVEIPKVSWNQVGGLEKAKRELIESIVWPLKYPKLFKRSEIEASKGILLYGPPGTGKTLLAKAVANEVDANFISIKGPELVSKYVGESERGIRKAFRKAKQVAPCILFFDEIDSIAPRRGGEVGTKVIERVVSQFLTEMSGVEKLEGVVVLAATNRKDLLDPALLRPGRFDKHIKLPMPNETARLEIFKIHSKKMPLAKINFKKLASKTKDFSGADIEAVCKRAGILATRKFVKNRKEVEKEVEKFKVKSKHFKKALKEVRKKN